MRQEHIVNQVRQHRLAWQGLAIAAMVIGLLAFFRLPGSVVVNTNYLRLNQALVNEQPDSLEQANDSLSGSLRAYPESESLLRGRALVLSASTNDGPALEAWRDYTDGTLEVRAWAQRAEKSRDWAGAEHWYGMLVALEPGSADDWYRYGQVLTHLGKGPAAEEAYQSGLDLVALDGAGSSDFLTRLGELASQRETADWTTAFSHFDRAITQDRFSSPANLATAYMGRAETADRLGQIGRALADYRWVAERQPNNYWAHVHGGRLTWYLEKDASRAATLLERAVEIDPANKWAYLNLALVYSESEQGERAVVLLEQALQNLPQDKDIMARLEQLQAGN